MSFLLKSLLLCVVCLSHEVHLDLKKALFMIYTDHISFFNSCSEGLENHYRVYSSSSQTGATWLTKGGLGRSCG